MEHGQRTRPGPWDWAFSAAAVLTLMLLAYLVDRTGADGLLGAVPDGSQPGVWGAPDPRPMALAPRAERRQTGDWPQRGRRDGRAGQR